MTEPAGELKTSDTYAKTLALLRRLLVGNGYALEDIKITEVEEKDLHLPGRLHLELQLIPEMTRLPGLAKGNTTSVFRTREEEQGFISNYYAELASNSDWVDDIRTMLQKAPGQGWGMPQIDLLLAKQTKRVSLIVACDFCKGQKMENCKLCFGHREVNCTHCHATMQLPCPTCHGSGANPADRSQQCRQCLGRMRVPCHFCHARGRIACHQCQGTGQTKCIECLGHGYFNEETVLKAAAQGRFELGSLASTPKGVSEVLETLGVDGVARGHAVITPMPSQGGGNNIEYDAILPYGRFNLKLGNDVHDVIAVGMKPLLAEFPPLLDDTLSHVPEELNAGSLEAMGRKYRLIRELAEAMSRGQFPARFFAQRYPYGLTAPLAFSIAGKLKQVFASISLKPRVIVAILATLLFTGAYYGWLTQKHPSLPLPPMAIDMTLAVVLAGLAWLAVALAGQRALKKVMPMSVSLFASGKLVAFVTFLVMLTACACLLYLPETRPSWLEVWLK